MSAGDILLTIVNWLFKTSLGLLPAEISFLSYADFVSTLDGLKDNLVYIFSGLGNVMPIALVFVLISVIMAGELILFGIKSVMFMINLIRGSGA
jgi:hypothetical protein